MRLKQLKKTSSSILLITALTLVATQAFPAFASATERQVVIETARKYLIFGLVEHKPDLVPLAEKCWRVEQGINTGRSGAEIKRRLLQDEYKAITAITNERWLVEGNEAVVFYDLHVTGVAGPVLIAERFRVIDRQITEIEAIFYRPTASTAAAPHSPNPDSKG